MGVRVLCCAPSMPPLSPPSLRHLRFPSGRVPTAAARGRGLRQGRMFHADVFLGEAGVFPIKPGPEVILLLHSNEICINPSTTSRRPVSKAHPPPSSRLLFSVLALDQAPPSSSWLLPALPQLLQQVQFFPQTGNVSLSLLLKS